MTEKNINIGIADLKVALTPKLDARTNRSSGYCGACQNYFSKMNRYAAPKLPGISSQNGTMIICTKCVNRIKSNLPIFLSLDVASVTERLQKKSESRNRTKVVARQNAENKIANLAQP